MAGFLGRQRLTEEFWSELESALVRADLGFATVDELVGSLRQQATHRGWQETRQAITVAKSKLKGQLLVEADSPLDARPHVVLLVGVNGSGKTTSAARLAKRWIDRGQTVLLAAADTYRAAAVEQLQKWADRLEIECVRGASGSDPGAVVFNALQKALSDSTDAVVIDTSGRMHTSHNLMAELSKIHGVARKKVSDAPHEALLVLDATTGQNGLAQARGFLEAIPITGVILTKLDGSAKGGIAASICRELQLPLRFAGTGETIDDLIPFDADAYVEALLSDVDEKAGNGEMHVE